MSTRSRSHLDVETPPPVEGPTDSPASAHDPWAHDYGPIEPPDPPVSTGRAFAETRSARNARKRTPSESRPSRDGRSSFRERMERAGMDPELAARYDKPIPGGPRDQARR